MEEFLKGLLALVNSAKDFTLEQAPALAQQLVQYEMWSNFLWAGFWATPFLFAAAGCVYLWRHIVKNPHDDLEGAGIFASAVTAVMLVGCMNFLDKAIKCVVAPKLVIVEKLSNLIKESK